MATWTPASRNGRAMSSARGYWFDWTPTRATNPKLRWRRRPARSAGYVDVGVRLVDHRDVDGDVRPKNLPLGAIRGNAVNGGERIRGDHRAPPADHISVVVVM